MTEREALRLALKALEIGLPLIEDFGSTEQLNAQHKAITAIYEALAQRTWVGLTDEEISAIDWKSDETLHDFARAIEAKLKDKNS
jgi:ABC-type lipoprotein export system ATPase subunit